MENSVVKKIPLRGKIGFASICFGQKITDMVMAAYILFFYTNALEINPGISATIILAAKIWDIINDPMMGGIIDRTHGKKEGNCRFYLKYGAFAMGLILFLSLWVPDMSNMATVAWITVTYVLYGMITTMTFIPASTLVGRVTPDDGERASLMQWENIGAISASLLINAYTMKMVTFFGQGDLKHGFMILGIIYGVATAVLIFAGYLLTKGLEPLDSEVKSTVSDRLPKQKDRVSLGASLKALLQNHIWVILVIMNLLNMTGSAFGNTVMPFYFQYNFTYGDSLYGLYSICGMAVMFIPLLLLKSVVAKLGPARTAGYGSLIGVVGYLIRFVFHDGSPMIMCIGWVITSFGSGFAGMVALLLIFDSAVFGEWKTGVSNDAMLISGRSASVKIGLALGGPIAGYSLLLVPYVEGAATQVQSVQNLFFYESTLLPLIIMLIPALFYLTVIRNNEKRLPQMRKEIEERKSAEFAAEQSAAEN